MSARTRGPWELGGTLLSGQHCIIGDGDAVVALLPDETMHCTYKPADANLIASAPELAASLEWALDRIRTAGLGEGERFAAAEAVLVKAVHS